MPVEVYGPTLANVVAAPCDKLDAYVTQLNAEIQRTASMDALELESEFKVISTALQDRTKVLQQADAALQSQQLTVAAQAVDDAADLMWNVAVFSGNPTIVGVAAGVELTAQTGNFIVQATQAKNTTEAGFAIALHVKNRTRFLADLVKSTKHRPIHARYQQLAKGVFKFAFKMKNAAVKFQDIKTELEGIRLELASIHTSFDAVVVNNEAMRAYRSASLSGARDFVAFLRTAHGNSSCQATHVPPTPGVILP